MAMDIDLKSSLHNTWGKMLEHTLDAAQEGHENIPELRLNTSEFARVRAKKVKTRLLHEHAPLELMLAYYANCDRNHSNTADHALTIEHGVISERNKREDGPSTDTDFYIITRIEAQIASLIWFHLVDEGLIDGYEPYAQQE